MMCYVHVNAKVGMRKYEEIPQQQPPSRTRTQILTTTAITTTTTSTASPSIIPKTSTLYNHGHHVHIDSSYREFNNPHLDKLSHISYKRYVEYMTSESVLDQPSMSLPTNNNDENSLHQTDQDNVTDGCNSEIGSFDSDNTNFNKSKLQRTFIRIAFSEVSLALTETAERVGAIDDPDNNQLLYESYIYS
ncbi:hypothetical protein C9374_004168 [Naegleria lovaniensis]|uniref:Uncharacterized protein n=1 Tax=Naegleria lovaniensis TaxID=51637 RepID=A0AA88GSE8_NAELO|nr:uncharacterized protein C9374_004168 [Naegleria lovaniensis]KAG2383497.1 hypothetical protein C9374_004168 [Naegleria lovaniensis]